MQDTTDEDFHRLIDTNLCGYFYCLRAAYPYLKQSGGGRIVQFSSSTALSGSGFANIGYTASKSAAIGMTKHVAGPVGQGQHSRQHHLPRPDRDPHHRRRRRQGQRPRRPRSCHPYGGRIAQPGDMAGVVLFLVSDESRYMTGTTLHVNGGKYMYGI